ncbi:MAG: hypothetical protein KAY00_03700 [Agitococcus sp.]|jgi:hypothetical protein|nr:hypothetical protein [Agitococcus sp.]
MSFAEQERALFDLLFDTALRERFIKNDSIALTEYQLTTEELADFAVINPHGLALDANVRVDLILGQWCRTLPLTFSLLSSLTGGLLLLRRFVDSQTMRHAPIERVVFFATRLRQALIAEPAVALDELAFIVAILDAELGMASTGASLKKTVLMSYSAETAKAGLSDRWLTQPVTLAANVSAAMIPLSYSRLKKALCPFSGAELWRYLNKTPLLAVERQRLWSQADSRLLVAKANVSMMSDCEPTIEYATVELAEGFASLFEYVNGSMSVQQILTQLQQMGAPESLLQGIQSGFRQLFEAGMVV